MVILQTVPLDFSLPKPFHKKDLKCTHLGFIIIIIIVIVIVMIINHTTIITIINHSY